MYKLTIRMRCGPVLVVAIACVIAMFVSTKNMPSMKYDVPDLVIYLAPFICAAILPLAYSKGTAADKLKIALTVLCFSFGYGLIASVVLGAFIKLEGGHELLHMVPLLVTTIGAVATTAALYKLAPEEVMAVRPQTSASATESVQPSSSEDKQPVEKETQSKSPKRGGRSAATIQGEQRPSSSATNLMGLLDTLTTSDDTEDETGDKLKAHPAKTASASQKPATSASNLQPTSTSNPAASASKLEPAGKPPTPVPATKPAASASKLPPAKPASSASKLQPVASAASTVSAESPPAEAATGEQKKPATSTATRLQAQKRKSTNTYIKLQALSASGTGSTPPRKEPAGGEGESGDSLKSMLDRLDTRYEDPRSDPMSLTEEVAMDSLFAQESLLTPEVDTSAPKAPLEPTKPTTATPPPAQPTPSTSAQSGSSKPVEPPSLSAMLDSLDTATSAAPGVAGLGASKFGSMSNANRMANPLAQNRTPSQAPKPTTPGPTPSKPTALTSSSQSQTPAKPATPSTPEPKPPTPVSQSPVTKPSSSQPSTTSKPATPVQPQTPAKPVGPAPTQLQSGKPATAPTPVKPTASPTKADATAAGAEAKPGASSNVPGTDAAQLPIRPAVEPLKAEPGRPGKPDPSRSDTGMLLVDQKALQQKKESPPEPVKDEPVKDEPVKDEVSIAEAVPAPEQPEPVKEETPKSDNLLGSVDREIDDIFSNLVPAEAQKEVHTEKSKPAETKPAETKPAETKTAETKTAETTITAKPEPAITPAPTAQPPEAKPTASPTPAPTPSPVAKAKETLFETGLDQEIDDIFSNLVPKEAQKEVGYSYIPDSAEIPAAPDTVAVEETKSVVEAKTESVTEGLFEESAVDKELDDIFSNLAPSEAHRNVNRETLSKLKALDPISLEAKTPVKDEPISFAPPDDSKQEEEEEAAERPLSREEKLKRDLENIRPGRFNETLASLPSMQSTIEGLLNNLAASESSQEESFAPPANEESFSPNKKEAEPVAHKVMDLLESLESSDNTQAPESKEAKHEPQSRPEESSGSGDAVDDLFGESKAATEAAEAPTPDPEADNRESSSEATSAAGVSEAAESAAETAGEETAEPAAEAAGESPSESAEEGAESPAESAAEPAGESPSESAAEEGAEAPAESAAEPAGESPSESAAEEGAEAPAEADAEEAVDAAAESPEAAAEPAEAANELGSTSYVFGIEAPEPAVVEPQDSETKESAEATEAPAESEIEDPKENATETAELAVVSEEKSESEEVLVAEETAAVEESPEVAKAKAQLKEFGRLSAKPGTGVPVNEPAGTMKTIGKLLIEVGSIENIIKAGESGTIGSGLSTARVISAQRGEGIKALLDKIDTFNGVVGSVIVGHDGLVIAATVTSPMDKDTLGILSMACLNTSNLATKKLEIGKLRQMVMLTDKTLTVLTDVDVGILAVFLTDNDVSKVDGVLAAIHDTIHGS